MDRELRLQIVDFLPRLRRFALALTVDQDKGDGQRAGECALPWNREKRIAAATGEAVMLKPALA